MIQIYRNEPTTKSGGKRKKTKKGDYSGKELQKRKVLSLE